MVRVKTIKSHWIDTGFNVPRIYYHGEDSFYGPTWIDSFTGKTFHNELEVYKFLLNQVMTYANSQLKGHSIHKVLGN